MKKVITIIAFQIGVDVLGFPQYHTHELIECESSVKVPQYKLQTSNFFKPFSKK